MADKGISLLSLATAKSLAVCFISGWVASSLHIPLPWMIGPLLVLASANFSGYRLDCPLGLRQTGQVIIATALGLYFTPEVGKEVIAHWGVLALAALLSAALAWVGAELLVRMSKVDRATAFFASVPGGAAEMTNLGERFGALSDRIALAQSVRVMLVVVIVPIALTLSGVHGSDIYQPASVPLNLPGLAGLLAITAAVGFLLRRIDAPNPFMLGPLFASIALTTAEFEFSSMPQVMTNAAQMFIGCALGSKFRQEFLSTAPRFIAVSTVATLFGIVIAAMVGSGLGWGAEIAIPTMILATAPGGIAEMCITAQVLHLGVPLITAAHVTRVVFLILSTGPLFRAARWARRRWGPPAGG